MSEIPDPVACAHCGKRVEAKAVAGGNATVEWMLPVDGRGWCSECCWMEGTEPDTLTFEFTAREARALMRAAQLFGGALHDAGVDLSALPDEAVPALLSGQMKLELGLLVAQEEL